MESSQTRDQTHVPWIGRFLSTEPPGKSVSYFLTGKTPASVTSEFQRAEQLLIKGGAALKPPEARLKGPVRVIKIRRLDHLRPWTHPSLVSSPTLLKLPRIQDCSVTQWCPILFESQVCVSLKTVTFFFFFTKYTYLFMPVLGLHCCIQAFSSYGDWELFSYCGAQA